MFGYGGYQNRSYGCAQKYDWVIYFKSLSKESSKSSSLCTAHQTSSTCLKKCTQYTFKAGLWKYNVMIPCRVSRRSPASLLCESGPETLGRRRQRLKCRQQQTADVDPGWSFRQTLHSKTTSKQYRRLSAVDHPWLTIMGSINLWETYLGTQPPGPRGEDRSPVHHASAWTHHLEDIFPSEKRLLCSTRDLLNAQSKKLHLQLGRFKTALTSDENRS